MRVVKSVCELALFGGLAVLVGVGPVNAQQRSTINQGFEEFAPSFTPPKGYTITRDTNIDGWNSSDTEIEVWANGFSGVESPEGGYFVELNPNRPIRLSQQICLVENEILNFSYRHRARANKAGTPDQIVEFSAKTLAGDSQQVFSQSQIPTPTSNGGVPWITRSGTDVIFNGQTGIYDVGFESFNRGSIGNLLDDINIVPIGLTEFDLSSAQGLENATTGLPEFVISGVVAEDTVITFDIRGTGANPATLGDDFTIQNDGKFTILKGTYDGTTAASRFAVPMTILDDSITEVNETLEISIARVDDTSGATSRTLQVGDIQCQGTAQSSATYTILDAEPEIEVSTSNTNGGAIADTGTDMLGVQTVGVSGTVTYTITNTGNDILNLGTPTIDAAGANVTGTSVSLPANPNLKPGQSTTITVAFTPVSDGGFNFAITVPNNDPDEAPYNINLQGLAFSVPVANPDESLGNKIGSSPRITVLTDDQAATGRLLDKKSVQFVHPDTAQPVSSLEVSGQETWRVDGDSGVVTFTPFGDFTGNQDVVSYTVADDQGRRSEPATIK